MSSIAAFSAIFCKSEEVVSRVLDAASLSLVTDADVVSRAADLSGMDKEKLGRSYTAKTSVFNKFTRDKERGKAWLTLAVAEMLQADKLLFSGMSGLLVPREVSHLLRVCLLGSNDSRLANAAARGFGKKDGLRAMRASDEDRAAWVELALGEHDPWKPDLYDLVLPMDKMDADRAASLIVENLDKSVLKPSDASRQAAEDFLLAARAGVALAGAGHSVECTAEKGVLTLTINKNVLMLHRLEEELKETVKGVEGVKDVVTKVGKDFHKADIYRRADFEAPSKVLLVDDEREFAETLSERLEMRDVGSAVVYDGVSALDMVREDEPEVMILDLKMPGIDGIEVLRRVKKENPDIEVIILTGHGSEEDKKVCLDLGAFAYLHKPVDIDILSKTLAEANEKIKARQQQKK